MSFLSSYDDNALILLLLQDDREAFGELYHRHWAALYDTAYKRLKNTDQCKDIVQDVFTDLWVRRGRVDIKNLEAYLHTAIRFQVYKQVVKGKSSPSFIEPFESFATSPFSADSNVVEKELSKLINTWLDSLPQKRKKIFVLHFVEGLPTKEIASRLKISQKTVQNQLGSSLKSLRNKLIPCIILLW